MNKYNRYTNFKHIVTPQQFLILKALTKEKLSSRNIPWQGTKPGLYQLTRRMEVEGLIKIEEIENKDIGVWYNIYTITKLGLKKLQDTCKFYSIDN